MVQQVSSNTKLDKAMTTEQFNQVMEAILAGKYSWACLLILRFAGYNPLHYIPYRTYNRLMKENCQIGRSSKHETDNIKIGNECSQTRRDDTFSREKLSNIKDIEYLEVDDKKKAELRGGNNLEWWLNMNSGEDNSIKIAVKQHNPHKFFLCIW